LGQLFVIYFPPLQRTFQTEALTLQDLFYVMCIASTVLIFDEGRKWYNKRQRTLRGFSSRSHSATGLKKKRRSWKGRAYETV
jgi:Ca2+-transporting ATPase